MRTSRPQRSRTQDGSKSRLKSDDLPVNGDHAIFEFLAGLDTPRALAVWLIYSRGTHEDLLRLTFTQDDMDAYASLPFGRGVDWLRRDYAATKLLSKASFLNLNVDRAFVAVSGARQAEQFNRESNLRIKGWRVDGSNRIHSLLHRASRIISQILPPVAKVPLGRLPNPEDHPYFTDGSFCDQGWTPGRTSAVDSRHRSGPEKYAAPLHATRSALRWGIPLVRSSPLWSCAVLGADGPCSVLPAAFTTVDHAVAITVPKNAKTDRLICYEPHVNIRLQRAVGVVIAQALKARASIDLGDQSVNQSLALSASKDGSLATLDLRMASDTLPRELIWELLPFDWVCLLDDLRSKYTLWPDGQISFNEKFSSMGNGFTFELETLVFYALCSAVSPGCTAYGDDLVIPTESADQVISLLTECGFLVNTDKSAFTGWFRESCGKDYYRGVDITPVYLKKEITDIRQLVTFHNAIRSFVAREVQPSLRWCRVMRRIRKLGSAPLGPSGQGDGHYHVNLDEAVPSRHPHGWDGWLYPSFIGVFADRLTESVDPDTNRYQLVRLSSEISRSNPWSLLATAVGPKRPLEFQGLYRLLAETTPIRYVLRKSLFTREWPEIIYTG